MKRTIAYIVAALVVVAGGVFVYLFWFAGGSGEPSTELTTPEVIATTTTTGASSPTTSVASGTETTAEPTSGPSAFVIDPAQTTASFTIGEVLRGEPQTVVGVTDQVAGQVVIDPSDLGATQFSPIVINARTLATDSSMRDRQIRGPIILDSASDEFEFITFTPTSIDGLDGATSEVGAEFSFQVTGDLEIRGTTNSVTFDVSVVMVDESTISGTAQAEVLRSDFGIGIPSVPSVADVTDEVGLALEFVATIS